MLCHRAAEHLCATIIVAMAHTLTWRAGGRLQRRRRQTHGRTLAYPAPSAASIFDYTTPVPGYLNECCDDEDPLRPRPRVRRWLGCDVGADHGQECEALRALRALRPHGAFRRVSDGHSGVRPTLS